MSRSDRRDRKYCLGKLQANTVIAVRVALRRLFRTLPLIVLLALPAAAIAESRTGLNTAQASVNFRIVIPAIVKVTAIVQPQTLEIGERDIARGYVDILTASSVTLTTNSRRGYLLTASYDSRVLAGVEVNAADQNMRATSGSGSMRMASEYAIDKMLPISYRLHIAPGVVPGTYAWPVKLIFSTGWV